jgi:large subunit ribosomal protein L21e
MPHHAGQRACTRHLFSVAFRKHGQSPLSKVLANFKKNDIVDIIADGSVQRGLPFKFYHGKTGKVFDVTRNGVGIIVNKRVNTRIVPKRIHVRIEHVRKSQSREAFRERVQKNDLIKREAKKVGKKVVTKRIPQQPRESHVVAPATAIQYMNPVKFRELY